MEARHFVDEATHRVHYEESCMISVFIYHVYVDLINT